MIRTLLSYTFIATSAALLAGCAGEETGTAGSYGTLSSATSAGSGGAGGGEGGAGQGGDQQTGGGGSGEGGGATGSGGAAQGTVVPTLKSMNIYMNCMPVVDPDPVHGSFLVDYDNTGSVAPSSATITGAKLYFAEMNASFSFSVMPGNSGSIAPGAVVQVAHLKQDGSGKGEQPPCNFCDGAWALEVTFDVNGVSTTNTLPPTPVSCVF